MGLVGPARPFCLGATGATGAMGATGAVRCQGATRAVRGCGGSRVGGPFAPRLRQWLGVRDLTQRQKSVTEIAVLRRPRSMSSLLRLATCAPAHLRTCAPVHLCTCAPVHRTAPVAPVAPVAPAAPVTTSTRCGRGRRPSCSRGSRVLPGPSPGDRARNGRTAPPDRSCR